MKKMMMMIARTAVMRAIGAIVFGDTASQPSETADSVIWHSGLTVRDLRGHNNDICGAGATILQHWHSFSRTSLYTSYSGTLK